MTLLCSGGPSAPKSGVDEFLVYSGGAATLAQLRYSGYWALALFTLIGLVPVATSAFCSTDPPDPVALTDDEAFAVAGAQYGAAYLSGIGKLRDLVLRMLWHELCECTSVSTPALPSPPAAPANPPVTVPNAPGGSYECVHASTGVRTDSGTAAVVILGPISLPVGADSYRLRLHSVSGVAARVGSYRVWRSLTPDFSTAGFVGPAMGGSGFADGTTQTSGDFGTTPGSYYWVDTVATSAGARVTETTFLVDCQGAGPGLPSGDSTCLTDAATRLVLDQILTLVTLIQRQAVPFAYVVKDTHAGLTGNGSITVADLIGMRIVVTDAPTGAIGVEDGEPQALWGLGWINWGNGDDFLPREHLSIANTLSLPPSAGAYTTFAYSLAPGVEVTLEELEREP